MAEPLVPMSVVVLIYHGNGSPDDVTPPPRNERTNFSFLRERALPGQNRQLKRQWGWPARVPIRVELIMKSDEFRQRFLALRNLNLHVHSCSPSRLPD